ncbi:16444_t:CDS:2, partial [Acaulospora colombiana]
SAIGEIVDTPNLARAFSYIPLTWAVGTTFAPLMGGYLSRPAEQFPNLFTSSFWIKYPYFLPCAVAACFSLFCAIMTLIFLQETHPTLGKPNRDLYEKVETGSRTSLDKEQEESLLPAESTEKPTKLNAPIPLRTLLTRKIILSVINYHILAILEISLISVMPVFFASCLHMEPSSIGLIMGVMGFVNGIIQITCFVPLHRRLGTRNIFTLGLASFLLIWCCFPLINQVYAQDEGVFGFKISAIITILILLSTIEQMSFNVIFLYVKAAAPSPSALGATNGIAQTVASIARAIGPAGSTSLFAASMQHPNILGGNMVYWVLAGITVAGIGMSLKLPSEPWEEPEENELQLRNEERGVDE